MSVLSYGGLKTVKTGQSYHEVSAIRASENCDDERLKNMGGELRMLNDAAVRVKMLTKTLNNFLENAVFLYKDMRKCNLHQDGKDAVIVAYETINAGETLEESLIVPGRLDEDLR